MVAFGDPLRIFLDALGEYYQRRGSRISITNQLRRVAEFIVSCHGPFTAEDLVDAFKGRRFESVSRPTIYRCLSEFTDVGLLRRIETDDGQVKYELSLF